MDEIRDCRIIAIANQKGGVGKTTSAINLAAAFAAAQRQTLVIDLDPQGNASTGLGIDLAARAQHASACLFEGKQIQTLSTKLPDLEIIPASEDLLTLIRDLPQRARAAFALKPALLALAKKRRGFILIDCPPGLNMLTLNALAAADGVIVPLQSEFFALEGLSQILNTLNEIRRDINPRLNLDGVLLTMFDARNNLARQVVEDVRQNLGDQVFKTIIPRNVRLSEAPSHGLPALIYDHRSAGAKAYMALAAEILQKQYKKEAA